MKRFSAAMIGALFWLVAAPAGAHPLASTTLRISSFDNGRNLPVRVGPRQGFFEANGLAVQITCAPNSGFLAASLLEGRCEVGRAPVDNLIAHQQGQGESKIPDDPDPVAFTGGDGGFLSVVATPGIGSFADLKVYRAAVDWIRDPADLGIAEALLVVNSRNMTPALATGSCDLLLGKDGPTRDLRPDERGIVTVLALRNRYAEATKTLSEPANYIDLTWYEMAFAPR